MLPNESLLQVLHFADYKTLVLAKLAGELFLRLATKFAEQLARRRRFRVIFYTTCITYEDVAVGGPQITRYEPAGQMSLAAACRELDEIIGPHAVASLTFEGRSLNMPGIVVIFEAAPPLKHAENVDLYWADGSTCGSADVFMDSFAGMKSLRLRLDYDIFRQFSWTFLRREAARELSLIKVTGHEAWTNNDNRSVEEFVHYCATLPHHTNGEPLNLDFSENVFYAAFGLLIIELLKNCGRDLTFRMKTLRDGPEFKLDERDYFVNVEGTTKRYVCKAGGIVVEVNGDSIAMQSTAQVI